MLSVPEPKVPVIRTDQPSECSHEMRLTTVWGGGGGGGREAEFSQCLSLVNSPSARGFSAILQKRSSQENCVLFMVCPGTGLECQQC